jgi:FtsH-binding integral membrane protein
MAFEQNVAPLEMAPVTAAARKNKVLRQTYMLLAISMIPTVIGAWFGVASGLFQTMLASPGISLVVFLGGAFGFMYGIEKNKESGLGVVLLLGFTFFMGIMLSRMVGMVLHMKDGANLVAMAFGGTSLIFFGMASLGTIIKRDLSGMGKFLAIGALVVFAASLISFVFPMPAVMLTIVVLVLGIFSAYIMYDVNRIVQGGETNYISATLALYMDIYNVFQALLALVGIGGSRD